MADMQLVLEYLEVSGVMDVSKHLVSKIVESASSGEVSYDQMSEVLNKLNFDGFKNSIANVYSDRFSDEELHLLLNWAKSPLYKKLMNPDIRAECERLGMEWWEGKGPQIEDILDDVLNRDRSVN